MRYAQGEVYSLPLPHSVDHVEALGKHALVVGSDGKDLHFTSVRLARLPVTVDLYTQKNSAQGETRSHGFFYQPESEFDGLLGLPIVVGMLAIASTFPTEITPLVPALQNGPLLTIHVSVMMISYAVLTVSFCGAVVYLAQGGEGRRRFASLPSAEAAGDLAHKAVMVGFPLLGLGIALGAWWANSAWGRYWGWDPKETSALVTWLSIAAYFHARAGSGSVAGAPGIRRVVPAKVRRGWRPDPMWWLIVMWVLVMFTYFAVNLWVSGLHSYAGV